MTYLIAETAWHHEGDFEFMKKLVQSISTETSADYVKMHITLNLDEYMHPQHRAYQTLRSWMFSEYQWDELIGVIRSNGKQLMLLLNDVAAIDFALRFKPEMVELHSVCLNVPRLQQHLMKSIESETKIAIGVGGCNLQEIDAAVRAFAGKQTVLMFGFQNYPTRYEDINIGKIRKIQKLYSDLKYGYADHTTWDESNNELITLLVAANEMEYVEKHVTIELGKKRCDYSASISTAMFNNLYEKIRLLDALRGDGSLALNAGEKEYSVYGPMKMAAITITSLKKGQVVLPEMIKFCRVKENTDISQIELVELFGKKVKNDICAGHVLQHEDFSL